jgi:hypothetical protein
MGLVSHGLAAIPRTVNGGIEPNGFHYSGALISIKRIQSLGETYDGPCLPLLSFPELPPALSPGFSGMVAFYRTYLQLRNINQKS